MSQSRRGSIADDWLEVESAASVISMDSRPSSPSQSPPPQETPAPATQVVESSHAGPSNSTSHSQLALRPKDNTFPPPNIIEALRSLPVPTPRRIYCEELPPLRLRDNTVESFPEYKELQRQPETPCHEQTADVKTNANDNSPSYPSPRDYHEACQHVTGSLQGLAELAKKIGGNEISTISFIHLTCKQLCTQTEDLGKMLQVYAQHWLSKGSSMALIDIPLNPDTWDALSDLKQFVVEIQDNLSRVAPPADLGRRLTAADIPLQANQILAHGLGALEKTRDLFTEFLPILKADFDEFRTKHMGFPPAVAPDRPDKKPSQRPNPKVRQIRDELYAMKDHFVMINVFFSRLKNFSTWPNVADPLVFKSLKRIITAITKVLTNNPTDWIESDMGSSSTKTMSYAQFMTLDPDVLSHISSHLQDFQDELGVDAKPGEDGCDFSEKMIHNHQEFMLLEGGKLQQLRSVIEFTESILMTQDQDKMVM